MSHFIDASLSDPAPHYCYNLRGFLCSCLDGRVQQAAAGLSLAQSASVKWTLNRVTILGSSSPGKTNVCTRMIRNRPGYFAHAQSVSIRPSRRAGPDDRLRWEGLSNEKWRIVSVRVRYPGPSTLPCLKSRARIPNDHYRAVHQAER